MKKAYAERTACKKGFNALLKRIESDITDEIAIEIIEESMRELKETRKELKERHTTYLIVSSTGQEDEDDDAADDYLDTFEKKFAAIQRAVFVYGQGIAKVKDDAFEKRKKEAQDAEEARIAAEENQNITFLRDMRLAESRVLDAECVRIVQSKDTISAEVAKATYEDLTKQLEKINDINNKIIEKLNNKHNTKVTTNTQADVDAGG